MTHPPVLPILDTAVEGLTVFAGRWQTIVKVYWAQWAIGTFVLLLLHAIWRANLWNWNSAILARDLGYDLVWAALSGMLYVMLCRSLLLGWSPSRYWNLDTQRVVGFAAALSILQHCLGRLVDWSQSAIFSSIMMGVFRDNLGGMGDFEREIDFIGYGFRGVAWLIKVLLAAACFSLVVTIVTRGPQHWREVWGLVRSRWFAYAAVALLAHVAVDALEFFYTKGMTALSLPTQMPDDVFWSWREQILPQLLYMVSWLPLDIARIGIWWSTMCLAWRRLNPNPLLADVL